jgi:phage regulator Rha-like protein
VRHLVTTDAQHVTLDFNNEPRADSRWLAETLGIKHAHLIRTIRKYEAKLLSFGLLPFETEAAGVSGFENRKPKGGRPEVFASLNEDQSYFVATLSRNTDQVVEAKARLVQEFGRLRRAAERRATLDWQQARIEGKDARRRETDTIQEFVKYATKQGSSNAGKYFTNITKMTYRALFLVEQGLRTPNGLRDLLDGMQLTFLATAEYVCAKALRDGMDLGMPYKAIYLLARERVEGYTAAVGRTPALPH